MNGRRIKKSDGFTVAELITVVAIVAILASVAMPLANFGIRRQKEIELHERLRRITEAIDRFHELALQTAGSTAAMKEPVSIEQGPWPKDLESLTKPIALNSGQSVRLLRERDLIDPMTGRAEWNTLSADDEADTQSSNEKNVYEIHSKSTALALDGKTHYNEW
ncbi:MAG TPA: prepilin-type N-terminal cleavage/methylation domain-containing protein [Thermoanaerobaculia bacterium]|nr:prepilin-type N-terminal cleavage/methylation domain-containing protein [Thermoanaerobaculia bacterium]